MSSSDMKEHLLLHAMANPYDSDDSDVTATTNAPGFSHEGAPPTYGMDPLANNLIEDAAIYAQEGVLLQPLENHPDTPVKRQLWKFLHTGWFPPLTFGLSMIYLALGLLEEPATVEVPYALPLVIQSICLSACLYDTWLRFRRYGRQFDWTVVLSILISLLLILDLLIYVFHSGAAEFHIIRALRPMYFLSTDYAASVRRVLIGICYTTSKVIDIIVLYLFYIGVFAVLGVYLFAADDNNWFFANLGEAYTQLFVLLTTCNYPNVMMPAYSRNPGYFLFFFVFIIVGIYFLLNLLLAMVYKNYTVYERNNFRKIVLQRRAALSAAYQILASDRGISRVVFSQFFKRFHSNKSRKRELLTFLSLSKGTEYVKRQDFFNLFDVLDLNWKLPPRATLGSMHQLLWFDRTDTTDFIVFHLNQFVKSAAFDRVINAIVLAQAVFLFYSAVYFTSDDGTGKRRLENPPTYIAVLSGFLAIYVLECLLKITALTFKTYWSYTWNQFDAYMTLIGTIGIIFDVAISSKGHAAGSALLVIRSFRLVRVIGQREAFQHLTTAAITILPRMGRFAALIGCVYYFFAIIGMTFFHHTVSARCQFGLLDDGTDSINNCGVSFVTFHNVTAGFGHYQLNNFDNLARSYVTLFELMVVNNWNNTMGGHRAAVSNLARMFFMLNYIVQVLLVVNVVIAFVLEAFDSVVVGRSLAAKKKHLKAALRDHGTAEGEEDLLLARQINISAEDAMQVLRPQHPALRRLCDAESEEYEKRAITYYGWTRVTSLTLFKLLYEADIPRWIEESEMDGDNVHVPESLLVGTRKAMQPTS